MMLRNIAIDCAYFTNAYALLCSLIVKMVPRHNSSVKSIEPADFPLPFSLAYLLTNNLYYDMYPEKMRVLSTKW